MNDARLIPLSHLELDLPAPVTGWLVELDRRHMTVITDDIGRACITHADARQLFAEHLEAQAHANRVRAEADREAVRRDREFRAQLNPGIRWHDMPGGGHLLPVAALTAAAREAEPHRETVLDHALSGEQGIWFHPLPTEAEDS